MIPAIILIASVQGFTQTKTGYAPVNGLKLYYEIHGQGKPVLLLNGSYMSTDSWGTFLTDLAKTRQVIAVDMQGHGRTADIDRPFSYTAMADDAAKLLQYLKIEKADVIGYSLGGTIALQLAIKNPELVDNLVVVSSVYKYTGWTAEVRNILKSFSPEFFDNTPMKAEYEKVAPDSKHWRKFVEKMIEFDKLDFDLGAENIKALKSPVLLVMGDNDGVDLAHTADMYKLVGGAVFADMHGLPKSQLAIIPGKTHVTLMMEPSAVFTVVKPFIDDVPPLTLQR
jgi:pimeloyl-ACP methyl ester carboxylesterase